MSEQEARELAAGFDLRPAWRLDDAQIEADAVAFWSRLNLLPADVKPERRAKELAAVAYKDGQIVGVCTAQLARLEQVRARLAMIRSATDPDHRRGYSSQALTIYARELLEVWAKAHPEERIAGMGAVIQSENLRGRGKEPVWPTTKLTLIRYTPDNNQVRVYWFEDFRLD
jgi:hypothetical protein